MLRSQQPRLEVVEMQPPATGPRRPPVLFVHGLGHGAWCWEQWQRATAEAGHASYAVSLRGHAGSEGDLRSARISHYVDDVVTVLDRLEQRAVLVGHSMGGLVVQRSLNRRVAAGAVLVASIPSRPGFGSVGSVLRQHPSDVARMLVGGTLPMRPSYLFERLEAAQAHSYVDRCGRESPIAQQQLLWHRSPPVPVPPVPVLALGTRADRLVPISDVRSTARRYAARVVEFDGLGHDLMLDLGWEQPLRVMLDWLASTYP